MFPRVPSVPIPINQGEAVPILFNFRGSEIGAVPTTILEKNGKVGAEIGAVLANLAEMKERQGQGRCCALNFRSFYFDPVAQLDRASAF